MTAERRMGKTQLIKKMVAESPKGILPIYRDVEDVRTPLLFVDYSFKDVEQHLSRWRKLVTARESSWRRYLEPLALHDAVYLLERVEESRCVS